MSMPALMPGSMTMYHPELTLREARTQYFALNDFGDDGGYGDKWVKIKFGRVPILFPNISSRASAVRYHDLHHILTEYPTSLDGEAEIAAWEIATGDLPNMAGWFLDLGGFAYGLMLYPRKLYRAFMRGRRSRSLYPLPFTEELLSKTVGEVRQELNLNQDAIRAEWPDYRAFVKWSIISLVVSLSIGTVVWTPMLGLGLLSLLTGEQEKIRSEQTGQ